MPAPGATRCSGWGSVSGSGGPRTPPWSPAPGGQPRPPPRRRVPTEPVPRLPGERRPHRSLSQVGAATGTCPRFCAERRGLPAGWRSPRCCCSRSSWQRVRTLFGAGTGCGEALEPLPAPRCVIPFPWGQLRPPPQDCCPPHGHPLGAPVAVVAPRGRSGGGGWQPGWAGGCCWWGEGGEGGELGSPALSSRPPCSFRQHAPLPQHDHRVRARGPADR